MTKETTEEVAALAAKYINCPEFSITILGSGESGFCVLSEDVRKLAASCLAQRETPEPSVSLSKLKIALAAGSDAFVFSEVFALIDQAEKESEK